MKKILIVFGTRPEAIKMAPLFHEFVKFQEVFETRVCVTAQHRLMLDQVLDFFDIVPDYDLDLMKPNQNLHDLTAGIISEMKLVFDDYNPDFVFVHGDTTTSMAASLAAFYSGCKVCHVEAGLRTNNIFSPFPEELNRQIVSRIAQINFSPTVKSYQNLLNEGVESEKILICGNTVIDALFFSVARLADYQSDEINLLKTQIDSGKKIILVTGHRRENHGEGFINICKALKNIAEQNSDVVIIYPVHLNPNVQKPVFEILSGIENIKLIDPLSYPSFVWLMNKSEFIITDSGGVQEEAPSLGKPVLVLRNNTERPEAVDAGTVLLVGTIVEKIVFEANKLLTDKEYYSKMSLSTNPYGDGTTCKQIVKRILDEIV